MIIEHFDKNLKRVGTSYDAHTLMLIRGIIILLILLLPIYPLVWIYFRLQKDYKEFPTLVKVIAYIILFGWFFIVIGYQLSKDTSYPFWQGDTWIYNDHETGEKVIQYKGIDY